MTPGKLTFEISMSLDGYVAGPNASVERPLGDGGERLHEWIYGLASWRESHGQSGGATGADDDLLRESFAATGAVVMGRRMFSGGEGPWADDPVADGWWGDTPPFGVPVFVLTHHARETLTKQGGTSFVFVTEGIESALSQAREAAGERNVAVAGGADVARQYLSAGLLDEMQLHLVPILLGAGVRLFEDLSAEGAALEVTRVLSSPAVTHLAYRCREVGRVRAGDHRRRAPVAISWLSCTTRPSSGRRTGSPSVRSPIRKTRSASSTSCARCSGTNASWR